MQNLKEIYYSSNLDPIPNPDLLFLSAMAAVQVQTRDWPVCVPVKYVLKRHLSVLVDQRKTIIAHWRTVAI